MSPEARRIVIPLIVTAIALILVLAVILGPKRRPRPPTTTTPPAASTDPDANATPGADDRPVDASSGQASSGEGDDVTAAAGDESPGEAEAADLEPLVGLHATAPSGGIDPVAGARALGSFDPATDRMRIDFARRAAGIESIAFSDQWETAAGRRRAEQVEKGIRRGTMTLDDMPSADRYLLKTTPSMGTVPVPILAAHSIVVDGTEVDLFGDVWTELAPGTFVTEIRDADDQPVLRITRSYVLGDDRYDITLHQHVRNLVQRSMSIIWRQYGPGDLRLDRARYLDRRRFRLGYLDDPVGLPGHIRIDDGDYIFERSTIIRRWKRATEARAAGDSARQRAEVTIWPSEDSATRGLALSSFASTNRYFCLAVHPTLDESGAGDKSLTGIVDSILIQADDIKAKTATIFTVLLGPEKILTPGAEAVLDLGVYAGPLDRQVLGKREPYRSLAMRGLVLYQMSGSCAVCTWQWLAKLLLGYLSILDRYVVFDWGVAIIVLVCTVRLILHPVTKSSQIRMQRVGKQMQALKPELDRLKKKYADDPKRMQQEQMRLLREHGINPLGCAGGMLPMFLQMPIWVALYAMLYFAFDIRQEPAFYGVFQAISGGAWPFLADLSAADHCFGELAEPRQFIFWNITGINVLPLLMGAIFFVQQKYMAPPTPADASPESVQQQRIMRVMMVVMFPLMLYSAPSGLTLYILTSSCIGIVESRYVRQHVREIDLDPKKAGATGARRKKKRKKPRDAQARAFAAAIERAKEKSSHRGPRKTYKKRR